MNWKILQRGEVMDKKEGKLREKEGKKRSGPLARGEEELPKGGILED